MTAKDANAKTRTNDPDLFDQCPCNCVSESAFFLTAKDANAKTRTNDPDLFDQCKL